MVQKEMRALKETQERKVNKLRYDSSDHAFIGVIDR